MISVNVFVYRRAHELSTGTKAAAICRMASEALLSWVLLFPNRAKTVVSLFLERFLSELKTPH